MRQQIIAANWKMHKTVSEAAEFTQKLVKKGIPSEKKVVIAPSTTLLQVVAESVEESGILVGSQNAHHEEEGAYTGEISLKQAKDVGAQVVIVGHSERRTLFGETDAIVNKKLRSAEKEGMEVILCVGESGDDRAQGKEREVVQAQIKLALADLPPLFVEEKVVIAYEPVWAIGTGEVATPQQAEEMHAFIRELIPETTSVIYGGSVKPENCAELHDQPSIDGFLVGGASLDVDSFYQIIATT